MEVLSVGKGAMVDLVVQDNVQERIIDVNPAVAFDEAHLPEFVHEEIDP